MTLQNENQLTKKLIADKGRYFCWVVRPASVQRISVLAKAWYRQFSTSTINIHLSGTETGYYLESTKYKKLALHLLEKFNSPVFIKKHLDDYQTFCHDLLLTGKLALTVRDEKKYLLKLFYQYEKNLGNLAYYFVTSFSVDDYVFPELHEKLKKMFSKDLLQDIINAIVSPTIVFGYQKYHQELLTAKTKNDFYRIISRYRWVREYSFQEKLLDKPAAIKERHEIMKLGLDTGMRKIDATCRTNKKKLRLCLQQIRDPRLGLQAKLVNQYINIKTDRIETYKKFQVDFREFFYKLLKVVKKDLPKARYEHMISLTDDEIIEYLKYGSLPDLRLAQKRYLHQFAAVSIRGKTFFIYHPKQIKKIRGSFLKTREVDEVKGNIVSSGKVSGRVKIIAKKSDLNTITAGQILVANFTTPEYVPAMKKAAGVVTDDGGITSHAAIISRELGKPCVTGTKIATQVFKDGDRGEVDANQGIIRKI